MRLAATDNDLSSSAMTAENGEDIGTLCMQ
jgi:hypothetical protein